MLMVRSLAGAAYEDFELTTWTTDDSVLAKQELTLAPSATANYQPEIVSHGVPIRFTTMMTLSSVLETVENEVIKVNMILAFPVPRAAVIVLELMFSAILDTDSVVSLDMVEQSLDGVSSASPVIVDPMDSNPKLDSAAQLRVVMVLRAEREESKLFLAFKVTKTRSVQAERFATLSVSNSARVLSMRRNGGLVCA